MAKQSKRRWLFSDMQKQLMTADCKAEDEWVYRLIAAIIARAFEDYLLSSEKPDKATKRTERYYYLQDVTDFVYSDWFAALTDIDPDWLIGEFKKARREKKGRYNSNDWRFKI